MGLLMANNKTIVKYWGRPFADYIRVAKSLIYTTLHHFSFGSIGRGVFIFSPLQIDGAKNMYIADGTHVGYKTWLAALPNTGEEKCRLVIGKDCSLGNFNHIYATRSIVFGEKVLTADKVYVSDNVHDYHDILTAVKEQPIVQKKDVFIGDGAWLGENVCVIGASVGKHSVVGANSVVTKDIPDYCIAVGIPAKVIKRYDFEKKEWIRC